MLVPNFTLPPNNAQVLLINRPPGVPQASDLRIETGDIPAVGDGQFLVRNVYLSVDPAQRAWATTGTGYMAPTPIGTTMTALGVGQVVDSRGAEFNPGDFIYGWTGWQDYTLMEPKDVVTRIGQPQVALSAYAGVLGINGLTAYAALTEIGRPRAGDTLLCSTAAGSVGSVVGQLGRKMGCRTIGLTGDDAKVARCRDSFGYDDAINYRTQDLDAALNELAPDGIDVFFDNVGGPMLDTVLRKMRTAGRIVQCGTAGVPAWSPPPTGLRNEREMLSRRLQWGGFVVFDHAARFGEILTELAVMIEAGELTFQEHVTNGIETAPDSLRSVYAGENEGKRLIFLG